MDNERSKTILDYALEYHRLGLCVIPIGTKSKKPALRGWEKYKTERPTEKQIVGWFSNGNKNIAVVLGEVSNGLTCRDFDTVDEYTAWKSGHTELAETLPTARTANGYHVYFEGHCDGVKKISNGELRGSRCYCLLPPSIHPDGAIYHWVNPVGNSNLIRIDAVEAGFVDNVTETTITPKKAPQVDCIDLTPQIDAVINKTLPKKIGQRDNLTFRFALELYSLDELDGVGLNSLRGIVAIWLKRGLDRGVMRTKEFSATWTAFARSYNKLFFKKGTNPMECIIKTAFEQEPPKIALELYPDEPKMHRLFSLCRELQRNFGTSPFFLSCRQVATILDVSPKSASIKLKAMVFDESLEVIVKGTPKTKKATFYKYLAPLTDEKT